MKKGLKIAIATIIFLAVSISGYAYYLYKSVEKTVGKMQMETEEGEETSAGQTLLPDKDDLQPITFLLLGIGDRPNDPGRSDSIIVISVNPLDESMFMFNIPRDTRMEIVGKGKEDKINHAYAYGRNQMVKESIESFLDQSIDYVIQINMNGFRQLVDALGGVDVNNPFAFSQEDELENHTYYFDEGELHLTGEEALHYIRMRKKDPRGDFGRNERQREVLNELIKKGKSFSSLMNFQQILSIAGENIITNLSFEEMKFIFNHYRKIQYNIETAEVKGTDSTLDGVYYYIVSEEERLNISEQLKEHQLRGK